ncbi:glucosamine--fructose-6-phosphate aminotransferase (isomerizing) [Arthrobacter sp. 1088]|uniref:SIS domain-containing protein n=1 Tax=Arthrobacter sp. 1088 TaxID=2817768 RepID=UPI002855AA76|nr:SIS domain-containing protein [Arthrobacter sp. 1088]MDR6685208.1 glucosamine--fructose-6-phosphate aminotransferase (isomerizing) [Arthrobacter sp. 1088]
MTITPTSPGVPHSVPATPGAKMAHEISEQPQVLAGLLDSGRQQFVAMADIIKRTSPRFVLLAARGTSDHAALYAKYLIEISLGLPVGLASPSTLTAYGAKPQLEGVLWLAVSQSGGSPDLVESTAAARRLGALTVAVTNSPGSPLAGAAEHHVDILAGSETAVAATKSYTAQLLALWLLVDAWRGGTSANAAGIPDWAASVLADDAVLDVAGSYRFAERIITTGRGYSYPTAREGALKLMETSYLPAQAFSGADLLHGPFAMIDSQHPVIAVVPEGIGGTAMRPVLERLAERGAHVCVVGDLSAALPGSLVVPLPAGVSEELSPILQILPLQRLALQLSVKRGNDPDAPRGLMKVTETW